MKSFLATAAILAAFVAGSALAAEPATATPPAMKDGMFVTAKGMTLYTFDKDTAGKSVRRRAWSSARCESVSEVRSMKHSTHPRRPA